MPTIILKNFTWRQTSSEIVIQAPLNVCLKQVDLVITNNYVKANCPPYILELFLYTEIIENESKCILYESNIILTLKKAESGNIWPNLELNSLSKKDKQKLREQVWLCRQSSILNCAKNKTEMRNCLQKQAVKSQISIDSKALDIIKDIRDECQRTIKQNLQDWSVELRSSFNSSQDIAEMKSSHRVNNQTFNYKEGNKEVQYEKQSNKLRKIIEPTKYVLSCRVTEPNTPQSNAMQKAQEKTITVLKNLSPNAQKCQYSYLNNSFNNLNNIGTVDSMPRMQGVIKMTFSERPFRTPARESSSNIEQEWLMKQVEARKNSTIIVKSFRQHEKDPQWLKDKGDEFFKAGNYLAAVNAYTLGIETNYKMLSLHLNRSAAHYALGNYNECIEDCSNVLKLMKPECEGNRDSRAKCYARRGVSLCKLHDFDKGLVNLETAFELSRFDESIKSDLLKARQFVNAQNPHHSTE